MLSLLDLSFNNIISITIIKKLREERVMSISNNNIPSALFEFWKNHRRGQSAIARYTSREFNSALGFLSRDGENSVIRWMSSVPPDVREALLSPKWYNRLFNYCPSLIVDGREQASLHELLKGFYHLDNNRRNRQVVQKRIARIARKGLLVPLRFRNKGIYVTRKQFFWDLYTIMDSWRLPWRIHNIVVKRTFQSNKRMVDEEVIRDAIVHLRKTMNANVSKWERHGRIETFWIDEVQEAGGWDDLQMIKILQTLKFWIGGKVGYVWKRGNYVAGRVDWNLDVDPKVFDGIDKAPFVDDGYHFVDTYRKKYSGRAEAIRVDCHEFRKGRKEAPLDVILQRFAPWFEAVVLFRPLKTEKREEDVKALKTKFVSVRGKRS